MHSNSSRPIGAISVAGNLGGLISPAAQNVRTPNRSSEMMAANPDSTMSAISAQVTGVTAAFGASGLSIAWTRPNFATNPGSGGRPAITSAQPAKDNPRTATAAGIPTPTGSSGVSSIAKASIVSASISARDELIRGINSIRSMNAANARVYPSK